MKNFIKNCPELIKSDIRIINKFKNYLKNSMEVFKYYYYLTKSELEREFDKKEVNKLSNLKNIINKNSVFLIFLNIFKCFDNYLNKEDIIKGYIYYFINDF